MANSQYYLVSLWSKLVVAQ